MSDFSEFEIVDDAQPSTSPKPARAYRDAPPRATAKPERGRRERQEPRTAGNAVGREMPHSTEAEEYLLSCAFLDGRELVGKAMASSVSEKTFYSYANKSVWEGMVALYEKKAPIDLMVLAEELKTRGTLDALGGYAYLMQVSQRMPNGVQQPDYFIVKLREMQCRREFITRATQSLENAYALDCELSEVIKPLHNFEAALEVTAAPLDLIAKPLSAMAFPLNDPDRLLGTRNRWISRGGSFLVVASAGVGKSTVSYQAPACWSVGRDFLGLDCIRPLRIIIVQAEDDDGDIGEVRESIVQGLNFTAAEMALFDKNVLIIRDKVNVGDSFLVALRSYVREFKPDLVVINPIMAYCPGLSKEEIAGPFFYAGLNGINEGGKFAYMIIHHTPKPPVDDGKKKGPRSSYDRQYTAFGSSILTNWPRAIINISPIKGHPGQFVFSFDKRGTRAGLYREVEQGVGKIRQTVTEIRVQHSDRKITVGGHTFPMILWEKCEDQNPPAADEQPSSNNSGGRAKKFTNEEVVTLFPLGFEQRQPILQIQKKAMETLTMGKTTFMDYRFNLISEGIVKKAEDGRYYR